MRGSPSPARDRSAVPLALPPGLLWIDLCPPDDVLSLRGGRSPRADMSYSKDLSGAGLPFHRLLLTCLSQVEVANIWIERIRKRPSVCNSICFIMKSSTNVDLLVKVGEVVDKLFDIDEELMLNWIKLCVGHEEQQASGEPEVVRPHDFGLVSCLLEAVKQLRFDSPEGLDVYMHILQLLTTVDEGVREIMHSADRGKVAWSLLSNLIGREFCQADDPPLLILEQKTVLSSILAVMSVMFSSQTDQEYMKAEANIPLIGSLVQVLQHMEDCQKEPLRSCKVKMTKTEAYHEDFHLKILKDICVEFLSNILILLSKENILEGLKHGHLSEHKCCCAIRNLLPLYCTAVVSFLKVLREADEKLADALENQFPSLRESTGQSSDAPLTGQPSE